MRCSQAAWLSLLLLLAAASSHGQEAPALADDGEAAPEVRFTIIAGGEVEGFQTTRVDAQGAVHCLYRRERLGEDLKSRFVLGANGIPKAVEITGTGELGEVAERFSWEGSVAAWSNGLEEGRRELAGPAFYVAADGPPEADALLARALLAAPGGRLPLLPAGEASLEKMGERELAGEGGRLRATLYAISGLGFEPTFVWLDAEGGLVGSLYGLLHVVRSGWEGSARTLEEAQEAAAAAFAVRRGRELAHRPQGALVFRGAGVFDAAAARVVPEQTVVVEGNRIVAVGPRAAVKEPAGAEVVDGRGRTLLPAVGPPCPPRAL